MSKKTMNISLGCGRKEEEGYIGLDAWDYNHNKIWKAPEKLPFDDDSVDFIKAHNFFEHLIPGDTIKVMNECWRVTKKDGVIQIKVPNVNYPDEAWGDPTHRSGWAPKTFKYYTLERPRNAFYGIKPWKLLKLEHILKHGERAAMKVLMQPRKYVDRYSQKDED